LPLTGKPLQIPAAFTRRGRPAPSRRRPRGKRRCVSFRNAWNIRCLAGLRGPGSHAARRRAVSPPRY